MADFLDTIGSWQKLPQIHTAQAWPRASLFILRTTPDKTPGRIAGTEKGCYCAGREPAAGAKRPAP